MLTTHAVVQGSVSAWGSAVVDRHPGSLMEIAHSSGPRAIAVSLYMHLCYALRGSWPSWPSSGLGGVRPQAYGGLAEEAIPAGGVALVMRFAANAWMANQPSRPASFSAFLHRCLSSDRVWSG